MIHSILNSTLLFAQQAAVKAETVQAPVVESGVSWTNIWLAAIMIIGSALLSQLLADVWRMKEYRGKFFIFIFATLFGGIICGKAIHRQMNPIEGELPPIKLGIDLVGGVNLVYEIDTSNKQTFISPKMVDNIREDLKSFEKVKVEQDPAHTDQVIVLANGTGKTEFNKADQRISQLNYNGVAFDQKEKTDDKIIYAVRQVGGQIEMNELVNRLNERINKGGLKEIKINRVGDRQVEITIPRATEQELAQIKYQISSAGILEFQIAASKTEQKHEKLIAIAMSGDLKTDKIYDPANKSVSIGEWVTINDSAGVSNLITRTDPKDPKKAQALIYHDKDRVTGDLLDRAYPTYDESARPAVGFIFTGAGATKFGKLTTNYAKGKNIPPEQKNHLAIILDNELRTAPMLNEAITGGSGIINGVPNDEVGPIVSILSAGKLPVLLKKEPVSQLTTSPELGEQTIKSGTIAMGVATLCVLVFMLWYYRFCGMVANVGVILNMLLVIAFMIALRATFTLAGIAGLVLSVGMAVDANVLIYERIREELAKGSALRMAIRNGFNRAMSTVVDSNLTTLLTGVVLYAIGTQQLKGFATTLILGLVLNLFTAVYCARIIFDVAERRGWINKLTMVRMIGETNFDFVKPVKTCVAISCIVIAAGLAVGFYRGNNFLDTDFLGGTAVQMNLTDKNLSLEEVRNNIAKYNETIANDKSLSEADKKAREISDYEANEVFAKTDMQMRQIKIVSSNDNIDGIKKSVSDLFKGKIQTYKMDLTVAKYEAPKAPSISAPAGGITVPENTGTKAPPLPPLPDTTAPTTTTPDTKTAPADTKAAESKATESKATTDSKATESKDAPAGKDAAPAAKSPDAKQSRLINSPTGISTAFAAIATGSPTNVFTIGLLQDDGKKAADAAKSEPVKDAPKSEPAKSEPATSEPAKSDAAVTTTPPADEAKADPTTITPAASASQEIRSVAKMNFEQPIDKAVLQALINEVAEEKKIEFKFQRLDAPLVPKDPYVLNTSLDVPALEEFSKHLQTKINETPYFSQATMVSGAVADGAKASAVVAIIISMLAIVLYVWFRFQNLVFGFAAVIALVHDVLITVGALAVSVYVAPYLGWAMVNPFKISLEVVAALLTIVGFSINDTIVIFDRIREIKGKSPTVTELMVNKAVNQTLGRTILTTGTVLIVTIILYIYGGESIHPFSFAMLIGLISGTYSTVYIAAPIVLWFKPSPAAGTAVSYTGAPARKPA